MKKKLLVIGAGFGQVPAIKQARKMGIEVIAVDKNPKAQGFEFADQSYPIDIIDEEGIVALAKKLSIDGAMTMQTDLPVPTLGRVNDALNLNGVRYKEAITCSLKIETRKALLAKGVSQPIFEIVDNVDDAKIAAKKIGFPAIVKAVDSSGSRGVTKVNSIDEVPAAFDEALSFSRTKVVLVEEYIKGLEIGAQIFSVEGKCEIILVHNDTLSEGEYMIPIGHSFPSFLTEEQVNFAKREVEKCIQALEIKNGPSNVDLILQEETGEAKIIEVGARIGATCLPELMYYHTETDWVEYTIKNALGEKFEFPAAKNNACAALILESPEDGVLTAYHIPDEVKNDPDLLELEVSAEIGEEVAKLRKGTDRIGKIVVRGQTAEEAETKALELRNKITFTINKLS